ncbi:hypothetical protein [Chelativorans sp. Marseille-P2723]|uniref:hypothetical protein n=1 Tax=Chelativorans sp. Marseille-P2723 TaxID=2709133 RepID=UPI00157075D8|nr:hypothetical protein [Chelativorans sp. Marseille-P2723]
MTNIGYSNAVGEFKAYLTLTLDLQEPIEVEAFAKIFAGLGSMFDDYLKQDHPEMRGTSNLYIREVRGGSIIADLVPSIPDMIGLMDNVLIVGGFASLFSKRVRGFIMGSWMEKASKSQLSHVTDTLTAVAADPNGRATLETVSYRENGEERELVVHFTSQEARVAVQTIEDQKRSLDAKEGYDEPLALLTFERPGKSVAGVGKRTGERAVVEKISIKPLPVIYASDMAEREIKNAFQSKNVFKRGFVVDVNVERKNGKPIAYRIMNLHQIIDLPDQD